MTYIEPITHVHGNGYKLQKDTCWIELDPNLVLTVKRLPNQIDISIHKANRLLDPPLIKTSILTTLTAGNQNERS